MFILVRTDCRFVGCDNQHLVKVDDDASDDYLDKIVQDMIMEDIEPTGDYSYLDDEEAQHLMDEQRLSVEDISNMPDDTEEEDYEEDTD